MDVGNLISVPFAFSESSITSVYIPENILIIGEGAFSLCDKLREVTLFPGLTTIEGMAFSSCDNLKIIFVIKLYNFLLTNARKNCIIVVINV